MMESIRELYRIGQGPSSSHTMAPRLAAERFKARNPGATGYRVELFGALAATGKGHLTDRALQSALTPVPVEVIWTPQRQLPAHPNGMQFQALLPDGSMSAPWRVYSLGGGALGEEGATENPTIYGLDSLSEIMDLCERTGQSLWEYVSEHEGKTIWPFLDEVWRAMRDAIDRGLGAEGVLPGGLGVSRKAWAFYRKVVVAGTKSAHPGLLSAYALAVSEENASGGIVVTAPTCGSCGIVPAVLRYLGEMYDLPEATILRALATAGLIGNLVKHNASISGAEVGCQGEVGVACAMAAGAAAQLLGGTVRQVEYAAETGLEHNLGLTCDPVGGLVQIPCIERNAFAAAQALASAQYALLTDGSHRISFDDVVAVMWETGNNLPSLYRETATGGLATAFTKSKKNGQPGNST